jgi:hypothetical protein
MSQPAAEATTTTTTSDITLSLVSHTNAGKTTLARTLLGRDIGEVRDAAHVTEFVSVHELVATAQGQRLLLADTPGFGDSARLLRRLRMIDNPLGWFLSAVWDRWRDRPFWAAQQALRHVQQHSSVLLYLVNAAESPTGAVYVAAEMDLLTWIGKPVLVLLNQLGTPRPPADEAADLQAWRDHLTRWPLVADVLPLDAFARCWVHERTLLQAVQAALHGPQAQTMAELEAAWLAQREATFEESMRVLANSLGRCAAARQSVAEATGLADRLRQFGNAITRRGEELRPEAVAQQKLASLIESEARDSTAQLVSLHGLVAGSEARGDSVQSQILARVAEQYAVRERLPEGRAAVLGGAVTGALTGLKADVLSGGLTLGGGMLAGGIVGALGAAGLARGINVLRDTGQSWVELGPQALDAALQAALLRYLAVAHFGRGRGGYVQGESPPHWPQVMLNATAPQQAAITALWTGRSRRFDNAGEAERIALALQPLLGTSVRAAFAELYPTAQNHAA